ncbi:hypothetical protein PsYK624_117670 [Phanerochaete sordida]|uniref:Uncharacterized protein n=1 Tax=Phanerochaete sordida TaxID=48140 RepID=A0A9P3GIU9_9APHY|nr:hypothetical protein PsYK624_117670 [Phanerochaete sordida]
MPDYDVRLLNIAPAIPEDFTPANTSPHLIPTNAVAEGASLVTKEEVANDSEPNAPRRLPWWRTRKFVICAIIFAVAAVAAVVGGAVGSSVHHSHSDPADTSASSDSRSGPGPSSVPNNGATDGSGMNPTSTAAQPSSSSDSETSSFPDAPNNFPATATASTSSFVSPIQPIP